MATGLLLDPIFEKHDTGPGHPESVHRIVAVTAALKAMARHQGIAVAEYRPHDVHRTLTPAGLPRTKATLCRILASHYPALKQYLPRLRRGIGDTEPYYTTLFMAVALGLTWIRHHNRPA